MGTRVYAHYNHTDPCKYARWTARESHEFMYARPWQHVLDYYSNAVRGHASLSKLFAAKPSLVREDNKSKVSYTETQLEDSVRKRERSGRLARVNFKIVLSYHGASFDGWQKQPDLYTVQGVVEKSLGRFVDEKKAQLLKDKSKPLEGCAVVAGRTDKGVSALNQVCSFYTWRKDVRTYEIEDAINLEMPGKLRVVSVSEVSRVFHPNFSAKWRRYLYIFPLDDGIGCGRCSEKEKDLENIGSDKKRDEQTDGYGKCLVDENVEEMISPEESGHEFKEKPSKFSVCKVNRLLRQLEGKLLSYKIFARDTKASRNVGPPTECFMYHARAAEATLPFSDLEEGRKVMCIELVANRFLRKMVRVLVATSIREAAAEAEDDVLIKLMDATCRRATAPPAPPEGLCLFDVGYDEFDPRNSLIS